MKIEKLKELDSFCVAPWTHVHVIPDGTNVPCCLWDYSVHIDNKQKFGNITDHDTIHSLLNGDEYKKLRRQFVNGERAAGCHRCYTKEQNSSDSEAQPSLRQWMNSHFLDDSIQLQQSIETTANDGTLNTDTPIRYIDIRLQQALAAIEKKAAVQAQVEDWTAELANGQCPEPIAQQLYKILFKPDKNAPEYKAVVAATKQTQMAPLHLLQQAGAIRSAFEFHWQRFLYDQFPKGIGFPALDAPNIDTAKLPLSGAQAFSIDDSNTTEIDDALSVQGLGSGTVTLGIHIAAPGLAIQPNDAIDTVARNRMSTMYMPGFKVTMLPDEVVQHYTLAAGRDCPALSLYITIDEHTLALGETTTVLERVHIADNLRHDQLGDVFDSAFFDAEQAPADMPRWGTELRWLNRLAKQLKAGREVVRGKPETFNRPDYNFALAHRVDHSTILPRARAGQGTACSCVWRAAASVRTNWSQPQ